VSFRVLSWQKKAAIAAYLRSSAFICVHLCSSVAKHSLLRQQQTAFIRAIRVIRGQKKKSRLLQRLSFLLGQAHIRN
jgi:hypothetical protein